MMILEEAQEDNRRQNEEGELLRRVPRYHNLPLEESSLRFCLRCPMTARRKSPVSQDFFVRWSEREQWCPSLTWVNLSSSWSSHLRFRKRSVIKQSRKSRCRVFLYWFPIQLLLRRLKNVHRKEEEVKELLSREMLICKSKSWAGTSHFESFVTVLSDCEVSWEENCWKNHWSVLLVKRVRMIKYLAHKLQTRKKRTREDTTCPDFDSWQTKSLEKKTALAKRSSLLANLIRHSNEKHLMSFLLWHVCCLCDDKHLYCIDSEEMTFIVSSSSSSSSSSDVKRAKRHPNTWEWVIRFKSNHFSSLRRFTLFHLQCPLRRIQKASLWETNDSSQGLEWELRCLLIKKTLV